MLVVSGSSMMKSGMLTDLTSHCDHPIKATTCVFRTLTAHLYSPEASRVVIWSASAAINDFERLPTAETTQEAPRDLMNSQG